MSESTLWEVIVVGAGAAGYFCALTVKERNPTARVAILEGGRRALEKVRISGGGRCNVTHACFEPRDLVRNYPRGAKELLGAFHQFQPRDTVAWFAARGVELKTEADGRMFPTTDSSQTILDCFERERLAADIQLRLGTRMVSVQRMDDEFQLKMDGGDSLRARALVLATGGSRSGHQFATQLGHTITPLAPSLFTLAVPDQQLTALSGVSAATVQLALRIGSQAVQVTKGPLLITHWGLSGPAVLKMSAWAARELATVNYRAELVVSWTGHEKVEPVQAALHSAKQTHPRKIPLNTPICGLSMRLWEYLCRRGLQAEAERPWNQISRETLQHFAQQLLASVIPIEGKGQFKEEFVTCGGVKLSEVDFRSMQSKCVPGLFFAGEILDIDGVTGGFNFQNAWTTGWIAGAGIAATPLVGGAKAS